MSAASMSIRRSRRSRPLRQGSEPAACRGTAGRCQAHSRHAHAARHPSQRPARHAPGRDTATPRGAVREQPGVGQRDRRLAFDRYRLVSAGCRCAHVGRPAAPDPRPWLPVVPQRAAHRRTPGNAPGDMAWSPGADAGTSAMGATATTETGVATRTVQRSDRAPPQRQRLTAHTSATSKALLARSASATTVMEQAGREEPRRC